MTWPITLGTARFLARRAGTAWYSRTESFSSSTSGNAKTLGALKASKKDKDLKAKVSGTLEGSVISVESIDLE